MGGLGNHGYSIGASERTNGQGLHAPLLASTVENPEYGVSCAPGGATLLSGASWKIEIEKERRPAARKIPKNTRSSLSCENGIVPHQVQSLVAGLLFWYFVLSCQPNKAASAVGVREMVRPLGKEGNLLAEAIFTWIYFSWVFAKKKDDANGCLARDDA